MLEILECISDVVNDVVDVLFMMWAISVDGEDKSFQENGHIRQINFGAVI